MADSKFLHIKGSRTQVYKTLPSNDVGNDGDIILSQIQGRGVYLCSKVNGRWHVSSKMEELRKIEKTSTKDFKTDKLRVLDDLSIGRGTTQITKDEAKFSSSLKIKEAANAISDTAAYGQLWVKTATPNELYFTTDAGDDIQITSGTATAFVGDITGVTAGDGLSGGGNSGAVSLAVSVDDSTIEINSDTLRVKDDGITYSKIQNVSATDRILGRDSAGAGVIEEITPANLRTMINVEDGATADQTKSDIDGLAITTVGTIDTGTWEGTTIAVDQGGTGATSLNNLITLSTHTTGNYVATLTAGALIDLQNNSGEGATPTIDVDLTEAGEAAIANGDYILFLDGGATGTHAKEAVADLATLFAGDGLTASSSVLAVNVDDSTIETNSDTLRVKDSGITLSKMADIADDRILGRYDEGDSGPPIALTASTVRAFLNVANGATANTGDITGVTAGTNCSGGGNSGSVTINVDDAFLINSGDDTTSGTITAGGFTTTGTWTFDDATSGTVGVTTVHTGSSFTDNDTSLMTAGAIKEKIESYGYTTADGDITSVRFVTDSGSGAAAEDTADTANFSLLGSSGVGITNSGTTITAVAVPAEIDHDSLNNFVANEHIDWTGASAGTIHSTNYSNTMGSGFTVSATTDSNATTITQGDDLMFTAGTGITCETTADGTVTISSTVTDTNTTYSAGSLLDLSTTTFNVDLTELTDGTADVVGSEDELVYLDDSVQKRKLISEIKLGQFNNDQGWTSNTGDITGVDLTGGTGISIDSETNTTSGSYSSTITCNLEGTELISTGETGGTKFLREDGDGTCSWQTVSASGNFITDNADDTMEGTLTIDKNSTLTSAGTIRGMQIDLDHTGNTGSGQTILQYGLDIAVNDDAATHIGGHYPTGINNVVTSDATGTSVATGIMNTVTGADTNYGIYQNVVDGGEDLLFVSSANTSDYFKLATSTNGETTLTTVDGSGSNADLTFTIDGHIHMNAANNINIEATNWVEFDGCGVGFDLVTPTYNASDTNVDFGTGNKQFVTFGSGNITDLNLIFPKTSGNFTLILKQDGTGSRTVTNYKVWDRDATEPAGGSATVKFAGGSNPTLTTDANHVDIVSFFYDGDNEIAYGVASLDFQF